MQECFGYLRAATKGELSDQETAIRFYAGLCDMRVRFVFSDPPKAKPKDRAGLKELLSAVKESGGGCAVVVAYRGVVGDYRKISQLKNRLAKINSELRILVDPYRTAPDLEGDCCAAILRALEKYHEALATRGKRDGKKK